MRQDKNKTVISGGRTHKIFALTWAPSSCRQWPLLSSPSPTTAPSISCLHSRHSQYLHERPHPGTDQACVRSALHVYTFSRREWILCNVKMKWNKRHVNTFILFFCFYTLIQNSTMFELIYSVGQYQQECETLKNEHTLYIYVPDNSMNVRTCTMYVTVNKHI